MKPHETLTFTVATFMVFLIAGFNDDDDHVVGKTQTPAAHMQIHTQLNDFRTSAESRWKSAVGNRKVTIGGVKPE